MPEKLLAEMDRDVLTDTELDELKKVAIANPLPPLDKPQPHESNEGENLTEQKGQLRYSGRTFEAWRDQLLNDLDADTCVKAMPAIVAFAKRGYSDKAIESLSRTLHDDRFVVVANAASSLREIGGAAAAALIEGLTDKRPVVRKESAEALGFLGASAKPAISALMKIWRDERKSDEPLVRDAVRATITALVVIAADEETLQPTFEQIVTGGANFEREALLAGCWRSAHPLSGNSLRFALRLSEDDDTRIRGQAGQLLAIAAPPGKAVIAALKLLLLDLDQDVWLNTIGGLLNPSFTNTRTSIPVLATALASADGYEHLAQQSVPRAIEMLGTDPDQAAITVPVLIDIVDGKIEGAGISEVHAAIEALGKLGPAARQAIPALERRIAATRQPAELDPSRPYNEFTPKFAERALRKIAP